MRLYIEGHSHKLGYAISRTWSDAECSSLPAPAEHETQPVRFVTSHRHAQRLVQRWNRRYATH